MNSLYKLGITKDDVDDMIDACSNILVMYDEEIEQKINILRKIKCNKKQIRNILICNPWYLDMYDEDVLKLIDILLKNKFKHISSLINANPYILNLDSSKLEKYINNKQKQGMKLEDIVEELETNPRLFDEIK